MTINLEQLRDGSVSDRNFQKLMRLVLDTGGQSVGIRFGTSTATWPGGGAAAGAVTIPHGLARSPVVAGAFSRDSLFGYVVGSRDATNIVVTGFITTNTVVAASSRTFDWIAVG